MVGVGRLTQKEHRRSAAVQADMQQSIPAEFVWSRARAVSGLDFPQHWLAGRTSQFPFTFNSLALEACAHAAGWVLDQLLLWN